MDRLKNSLGIWMAGINPTRFMAEGYHADVKEEPMPDRYRRIGKGLGKLLDGFEGHYPQEINEDLYDDVMAALNETGHDFYAVACGTFCIPKFYMGSAMNPDPGLRRENAEITNRGIDMAARLGAKFIIWPGNDGYNYPNQADYKKIWHDFLDSMFGAAQHCAEKGVTLLLEDKNSEPKMRILMANQALSILVARKIKEQGIKCDVKVNMDWQHLIMRGENLPHYAALLDDEGLLGHQHANSGWGQFDDDNIVGASYIEQTLGMAIELQLLGYGKNGERIGYDLFPYTEDQVEAAKMSIRVWNHLWDLASKITDKNGPFYAQYIEARKRLDTIAVLKIFNHVLMGLPLE